MKPGPNKQFIPLICHGDNDVVMVINFVVGVLLHYFLLSPQSPMADVTAKTGVF